MSHDALSVNRLSRNDPSAKWGKKFSHGRPSTLAAACAAVLGAAAPFVRAAPVVVFTVTNPPLTMSPTSFTGAFGPFFNGTTVPQIFSITINDPNAYGGNYRLFTNPAGGSVSTSSNWDYGDYVLTTQVDQANGNGIQAIVDSTTNPNPYLLADAARFLRTTRKTAPRGIRRGKPRVGVVDTWEAIR
jgi:hypothetical protein